MWHIIKRVFLMRNTSEQLMKTKQQKSEQLAETEQLIQLCESGAIGNGNAVCNPTLLPF